MDVIEQQKQINPLILPGMDGTSKHDTVETYEYDNHQNLLYPELRKIGSTVAAFFSFDLWEVKLNTRKREIVQARQIAMYFSKSYTNYSLSRIGSFYGRDHATVWHSEKTVNNLIETDKVFRQNIKKLDDIIKKLVTSKEKALDYHIEIDQERKEVHIRSDAYINYSDFKTLAVELEKKNITDEFKIVML